MQIVYVAPKAGQYRLDPVVELLQPQQVVEITWIPGTTVWNTLNGVLPHCTQGPSGVIIHAFLEPETEGVKDSLWDPPRTHLNKIYLRKSKLKSQQLYASLVERLRLRPVGILVTTANVTVPRRAERVLESAYRKQGKLYNWRDRSFVHEDMANLLKG
jgi:hypothetical protein